MDYDKILFSTQYPIDKVVHTGSGSYTVPFTVTPFYNNSGTLQTDSISNPYGKKAFIRFAWSIDGVNYNAPETKLEYEFNINATAIGGPATNTTNGIAVAAAMGCDASNIYFISYNCHHGNVVYTAGDDAYSGSSHTFYYKYALFEVE